MGKAVLIGAGIGAAGSALTGRDPIKGAAIGAGLGAGYGGATSAMKGGSFMDGAFPFMGETTKASSLGTIAQGGGATMPAYLPEMGVNMSTGQVINPVTMSAINSATPAMMVTSPMSGGLQAASTSVPMMQQLGYTADEIKNLLPDLSAQNVGNIIGGANVARQYMQRPPLQQAPSGGIKQGNPPAATPINELIGLSRPQPKKRISLLVG
jgi:hypothetical protein